WLFSSSAPPAVLPKSFSSCVKTGGTDRREVTVAPTLFTEEYQCTGVLEQDFIELCNRSGVVEIPKVVASPHPLPGSSVGAWQMQGSHVGKEVAISVILLVNSFLLFLFSLWKVGLTDLTLLSLIVILPNCQRTQGRETNLVSFTPLSRLAHVSLRNNSIDDETAKLIGQALSTLKSSNKSLVSINLSYNHITDLGAGYIAEGLRLNRSLLSVSLANNRIGDEGALKLAEVLASFALTHTEVVERRRLLLEKESQEHSRSPQRHSDSRSERPLSLVSNTTIDKLQTAKPSKCSSKKKVRCRLQGSLTPTPITRT
uniref:Leucine rich repeat containing 71 n=1 Tax=Sphenodon punctatus TaxID=8508 RepID=A0A8D0G820_SPHPU